MAARKRQSGTLAERLGSILPSITASSICPRKSARLVFSPIPSGESMIKSASSGSAFSTRPSAWSTPS